MKTYEVINTRTGNTATVEGNSLAEALKTSGLHPDKWVEKKPAGKTADTKGD